MFYPKYQGVEIYLVKQNKPTGICHLHHKVGVEYMGGKPVSPTNYEKGRANKRKISMWTI